jgi:hypothetical protein
MNKAQTKSIKESRERATLAMAEAVIRLSPLSP